MTSYNITDQKRLINNIPTVDKCQKYLANVIRLGFEELIPLINRRMVEVRAQDNSHEIVPVHDLDVEQPAIVGKLSVCLAAYEQTLKNKYAGRIRPQINTRGFIETVDSLVQKRARAEGFQKLKQLGLEDYFFELVVVDNPQIFSEGAVDKSIRRLAELG